MNIERKKAREEKDWVKSDSLREKIKELGFEVKDLDNVQEIKKI
jgi:cysteinyl-tRNA synthetase